MNLEEIEKEISAIQERNKKVETDKAWEVSLARKILIAVMTYVVVLLALFVVEAPNPYLNAFVPSTGFLLSTLSLPWFKKKWIESRKQK
ncbi:hypothetical protein K2P56_02400 [Patescibacteria group bacterium]|nr:hypothetical protein [Patescibacteria group bacterium]